MMRKLREARDEEGFTLIELLVVVLIIGILAAIAIPVFLSQREKAFQDAARSDLRNGAIVMEDYYSDNAGYPSDVVAAGLQQSDDVTVTTVVVAGTDGYCLWSEHTALDNEYFEYDARGAIATAQVTSNTGDGSTAACA